MTPTPPVGLLQRLFERGVFSPLDYHFARTLSGLESTSEDALLCAALASRAVQLGHVCVELARVSDIPLGDDRGDGLVEWPPAARLKAALEQSALCGDGSLPTPLVLDAHGRLYLQRYAVYERALADMLRARARRLGDVDLELLARGLHRSFPRAPSDGPEPSNPKAGIGAQELAACVACLHPLAIICGGPGTGKTTTVVKILSLLQEQALGRGRQPLRMLLLAPTGKAARRLAASVAGGLASLSVSDAVRASLPREASTIHRALGGSRMAAGKFRYDADNPLPADLVLVDEVSMVDLALLYRLLSAIRPQARVILQGDKDQLASVEAGAILGDIYDRAAALEWSAGFAQTVQQVTGQLLEATPDAAGLCDCLISLDRSYRYADDSGIGRLARAINAGDAALATRELLDTPVAGGPRGCELFEPDVAEPLLERREQILEQRAIDGYTPFIASSDPGEKLARLGDYRILCAHRQGPQGVARLNASVELWLARANLIQPEGSFYENRPIIITQNDYALGLFNGDVGVVVQDSDGRLRVCFEGADGLRFLAPGRLPPHETVFATTIHKSQGSEFDAVSIVLPELSSALVGRELLYTAVTRARQRVDIFAPLDILRTAIGRSVQRASGLHDRLFGA